MADAHLGLVDRDVFTNQDPGKFVECEEVSKMSLNPWIGECPLPLLRRRALLGRLYTLC